ncbi:PD-(D/E)XK nuclease family protein [Magnetospirillum sp. SS-4]|uniref:PD-(D/E)XK nuclease family protein n=1 Tax=Magnetospirillum sp. SS-4 TaxID=2681465 RepID=UPI0013850A00|nr:PD-(D/E)XK nuclease family protein [Magnetospirillum sp. SS-4]CAA7618445.1 conserved hypothetical protein [Magnetospirillum sp. SS-4]
MDLAFGWPLDGRCHPLTVNGADHALGKPVVGPTGMLSILEVSLGLTRPALPAAVRIARYQVRMKVVDDGRRFFSGSFGRDAWATARQVLTWRDSLFAAGWNGEAVPDGGDRLVTLAALEKVGGLPLGACPGERLQTVIAGLSGNCDCGISRIRLVTDESDLPHLWRVILGSLKSRGIAIERENILPAATGTDLAVIQSALQRGKADGTFSGDGSFLIIDADDEWQAADAVAGWLGSGHNTETVLVRGSGSPPLDMACQRLGLPKPGWHEASPHRSVLQVLPLALEILWEPLNAARLLEFLTLPRSPIPGFVARRFASALMETPGTGGEGWNEAWKGCLEKKAAKLRQDGLDENEIAEACKAVEGEWRFWLQPRRFRPEDGLPATLIQETCRNIAQWAAGIGRNDGDCLFLTAASHASALGEAVASMGLAAIPAVQLGRIVDAVTAEGVSAPVGKAEAAPWMTVDAPGQIWGQAETVIWWNFTDTTILPPHPPWSAAEINALSKLGVPVEPAESAILREAETWLNAVMNARSRLILAMPRRSGGETVPPHPLWHEIHAHLQVLKAEQHAIIPASLLTTHAAVSLAGRTINRQARAYSTLPPSRRSWPVPAGSVRRRKKESISSIRKLIECPFAWALKYGARIGSSGLLALPDDDNLIGTLAHAVVEKLFAIRTNWGPDEAAGEAARLFDALVPAIAAPLLRPGFTVEYRRSRTRVIDAIRMLVGVIAEAGLTVRGCEEEVSAPFGPDQEFRGFIDLALKDGRGHSVILDLKWNRSDKYRRKELRENQAMQLAAYTWLEEQAGRRAVGAGYFMLRQQSLIYSEPDPFPASHHVPGTDLGQLWTETQAAYNCWMADIEAGTLVARGVEAEDGAGPEDPMPRIEPGCRFCDYRLLCGAELEEKRK